MTPETTNITFLARRDVTPPTRKRNSNERDNSSVLIAGRSREFKGAPVPASLAAMRAGADLFSQISKRISKIPSEKQNPKLL